MATRGGRRQGRAGAKYPNRSDLSGGARLPIATGPSQQYGERAALEELQRALPSRRATTPVVAPGPAGAAPPPAPPPPLDAPTDAPDEPITAGSSFGPGPGPEVLAQVRPQRLSELLDLLPATGDLADLRVFARQRGL